MRTVQPTGPYYLAGYSYGGVVAFEMACQLCAQGEQTALLVNMVGYAPHSPMPLIHARNISRFVTNAWYWLIDYFARPGMKDQLHRTFARMKLMVTGLFRKKPESNLSAIIENIVGDTSILSEREKLLRQAHVQAIMAYEPGVFPGRLTLFRVRTLALSHWDDPEMGWGTLAAGGLDVRQIPGAHYNILESPHVEHLSQQLMECIAEANESLRSG